MSEVQRKDLVRTTVLTLAALVVVGVLVWALSQQSNWYESNAANRSRYYARNAENEIADRCIFAPAENRAQCVDEAVNAARSNQREEQDLSAQKGTAWWTRIMGAAALMGMVLSAIGVFLVFITFRASRDANSTARREFARARIESRKSAKSAEESLALARASVETAAKHVTIATDAAYRELRAYISVEGVPITFVGTDMISGQLVIKNAGKTPAKITVLMTGWIADFPNIDPASTDPAPVSHGQHSPFINAHGEETVHWYYPATGDDKAGIASLFENPDDRSFYFYGRVEFLDYMRRRRVLNFSYRHQGIFQIGRPFTLIACPCGNEYEDRGIEEA